MVEGEIVMKDTQGSELASEEDIETDTT